MSRTRVGRKMQALAVAVVVSTLAVGSSWALGGLVASPVGASGSTLYMSVSNAGTGPVTTTLNVMVTSGSTTVVGSKTVSVAPLSTTVVAVPMSGPVSLTAKSSLSTSLQAGIIQDAAEPF